MNLENQVVSLELAKKIEKLGVKQESYFKWNEPDIEEEKKILGKDFDIRCYPKDELLPKIYTELEWSEFTEDYNPIAGNIFSAFTVAELGEILSQYCESIFESGITNRLTKSIEYRCTYGNGKRFEYSKTEADARAKMLIYLIENKRISK